MNRCHCVAHGLALLAIWHGIAAGGPARADSGTPDQPLPPFLSHLPLDRLSSGALRRLDQGGNLVAWPAAGTRADRPRYQSADGTLNAGLDPRVGSNLRLGDDPAALPSGLRAQAEPHIVRDPHHPDTLLATFQEGRYTNGGAVNCGYAVSHDGGLTWMRSLIQGLTLVSGGPYYRATDPVAGVDHQGRLYLNTLVSVDESFGSAAITLHRSTNGGATFDPPVEVYRPASTSLFPDKNWMAVNTFPQTATAGRIVVTWTMFTSDPHPLARVFSDDGGVTWSTLRYLTPASYYCQGSQPLFLPDGSLAVVYWNFDSALANGDAIEIITSSDGGNVFNALHLVTPVTRYDAPAVRDGLFLPSAAADRTNGVLFVTYQALHQGAPRIMFTKSANKGVHWTTPKPASDNPANAAVFNPAIAVSPDGQTVAIVFYDGRVNPGATNYADVFLAQSFNGGTTWQPNLRVTPASSDVRLAPLTAYGYMLGDYLGIAPGDAGDVPAVPVWVDTRAGSPDPFIARIGSAPQITFPSWRAARFSVAQIADANIGSPGANPDGDAYVNLMEYALGLHPWSEDSPELHQRVSASAQTPTFDAIYERLGGASDLSCFWLASTNLASWKPTIPMSTTITTNANRRTETVTATFAATNGTQFHRLAVTLSQ